MDISGSDVYANGLRLDISGSGVYDASGTLVGTTALDASGNLLYVTPATLPTPPPQITLADILAAAEVVTQKETQDRAALESITTISFEALRASLIQWAKAGFPNAYPVYTVGVVPPETCSDGVKRSLSEYVTFLTEKTMPELIAGLQARLPDITVSFATTGPEILIVVTKA